MVKLWVSSRFLNYRNSNDFQLVNLCISFIKSSVQIYFQLSRYKQLGGPEPAFKLGVPLKHLVNSKHVQDNVLARAKSYNIVAVLRGSMDLL